MKRLLFIPSMLLLFSTLFIGSTWAALTQTQASQLYVSVFGRASEGSGNSYWQTDPSSTSMTATANVMLNTDPAKAYFGTTLNDSLEFIKHIYLNTLGKTYSEDPSGIDYWVSELDGGKTKGEVIAALIVAAQDPGNLGVAQDQFNNKIEVSNYCANIINEYTDFDTFEGFISPVTDAAASVASSKELVDLSADGIVEESPCGAYVAPGVWKQFDCYNLAAIGKTTNDDPFTPSWRLIGGYWQWGRKGPDSSQWYDTNTAHFAHGPTGPDSGDANDGEISGWDRTDAPDGSWSDVSKTANDPCPAGYRVPTSTQWTGVKKNNTQSTVGSWSNSSSSSTYYSSARSFGNNLMLPAAGTRYVSSGLLYYRGKYGYYWSSTQNTSSTAWDMYFYSSYPRSSNYRSYGFSVRCVAE